MGLGKRILPFLKIRKGIIHIGANDGGECAWYDQLKFERVLWFEPIKDVFLKLQENIAKYPNQMAMNFGIHDTLKTAKLHVSSNRGLSSSILEFGTHKELRPDITYIRDEVIDLVRMDEIINKEFAKHFNFIVIDTQGVELNVLKSFGDLLYGFDYIFTEVYTDEGYKGCALLPEIDQYLLGYGFKRMDYFVDRKWHWGDAFYVKN